MPVPIVIESAPFSGDPVSSVTVPVVVPKPEAPVRLPASNVMSLIRVRLKFAGLSVLVLAVPDPLVTVIGPVVAPAGTVAVS